MPYAGAPLLPESRPSTSCPLTTPTPRCCAGRRSGGGNLRQLRSSIDRVTALLALSLSVPGCSLVAHVTGGFDSPAIELAASKVESISLATVHLVFEFVVHNPNAFTLMPRALRYRLTVNHNVLAEGRADVAVSLPPLSSTSVPVPMDVRLDRLSNAAHGTTALGEIPYDLDVWRSIDSWLHPREVHVVTSSVLRMNVPLGLARGGAVAFPAEGWQS